MKFKQGDTVNFIGTRHYTRPNGKVYFTVKPGVVTINAIMESEVAHPYHILAEPDSTSNANGWVAEQDLKEIPKKEELKIVSLANSRTVKIAYAKNTNDGIDIVSSNWEDQKWIAVFRPKDPEVASKLAHMAEVASAKKHFETVAQVLATTFIDICADAANIPIAEYITRNSLIRSGLFTEFTSDYYTKQRHYLRRGDILLSETNSAIVLSNGKDSAKQMPISKPEVLKSTGEPPVIKKITAKPNIKETKIINAEAKPQEKDYDLTGMYKAIIPVEIKTDAKSNAITLAKLPKGIIARNYGYYTENNKVKWYYVQVKYKDTVYNGFIAENDLIKQ